MQASSLITIKTYSQIVINESSVFRVCLDTAVSSSQHIYHATAIIIFITVNEFVSAQLNSINQQVGQMNMSASQFGLLKKSYYLCNEMVNEMNDTFGLMLLSVTLYDFVKIVTEGMYVTVNYSNHNEWYIYVLNTLAILYSLASFFVISLRAQYLTHRVNFSHSFYFLL